MGTPADPFARLARAAGATFASIIVFAVLSAASAGARCPGDCDGNGAVAVGELIRAVGIALGRTSLDDCPAADSDGDGSVRINDLITAVSSALDGCPDPGTPTSTPSATDTATPTNTPTATASATPDNESPQLGIQIVYRGLVGSPIAYQIDADDPDGDNLTFEADDLPEGAVLDGASGVLSWTPREDQAGAYEITVRCLDGRGGSDEGTLPLRVLVLDSCARDVVCDAASGCEVGLPAIAESCCAGEPEVRVPEPAAECMPGLVLHAGRNQRGFGRMQNCDLLQVRPFGQGSANIRFNVEARCVSTTKVATLNARLETADRLIFDRNTFILLDEREDGFSQELALFYQLNALDPADIEGREAQLTLQLLDGDGVMVERALRVVLTSSTLGDLPDPDREDIPAGEAGCVGCHRPRLPDGSERFGIEEAHPWAELTCTRCHGGNAAASTRAAAHVSPSDGPEYLKSLTSDELDSVSLEYLRFINPGDLRVVPQTCGSCHPEQAANVPKSVMSTYAAHYTLPRYLAGVQGRESIFGAVDIVDEDFDPLSAPPGAIPELQALRGATTARDEIHGVLDEYLPKACPTCHLQTFGPNDSAGSYRSSGCTSCHMVYDDDGLSRSDDPMISKSFPSHPRKHALTTAIPVEQCAHCHFQGGRIGLAYRGIREGGFAPEITPILGQTLGTALYGHDADYYFSDEDRSNRIDETPPDLHFEAGMVCIDCHVGGDVHGDGNLYASERDQVGIRCEDCHGTVRAEISPGEDGVFRNSKGFPLRRLRRDGGGVVRLELATEERELAVTQVFQRLQSGVNPNMIEAMGVDDNGFSHTDSMECYTCHTSWRQTCFGCHVTIDDRGSALNRTTGETTLGALNAHRDDYSLDFYALGVNKRGKITPLCSSMSMFFSYVDEQGNTVLDEAVRTSGDGKIGFGWNPFHHHTVSRIPQNCDVCHPTTSAETPDNQQTLRETYGFGNGEVIIEDGAGNHYDVTAFLDESGELRSDFPHANTGPVAADVRQRALGVLVTPHSR